MLKTKNRGASRLRAAKPGRRFRARAGTITRRAPPHPDPKVVRQAEKVFAGMGMTPAEAVALFYKQTALHGDFPITELIPNEETQAALREPPESLVSYGSVDEMIADLMATTPAKLRRPPVPTRPHRRRTPAHPDPKVVKQAEKIFAGMGMTACEAVGIFYKQTALHGDFPITELIPNEETQLAIWDALAGIGIKKYASVAEMRADLDNDA